jgi:hypothetical protein
MDLADVAGNVVDGVHIASTGGVWMALTYGFGGCATTTAAVVRPAPAVAVAGLRFPCASTTASCEVDLTHERFAFELPRASRSRSSRGEVRGEPTDRRRRPVARSEEVTVRGRCEPRPPRRADDLTRSHGDRAGPARSGRRSRSGPASRRPSRSSGVANAEVPVRVRLRNPDRVEEVAGPLTVAELLDRLDVPRTRCW